MKSRNAISASHRRAANAFLEAHTGRFRRAQIAEVIYPLTSPRSRTRADQVADQFLRGLAADGAIQREGHLHWIKVESAQRLLSGALVPQRTTATRLDLNTCIPDKWLSIDLASGEIWQGHHTGWRRAKADVIPVLEALLVHARKALG